MAQGNGMETSYRAFILSSNHQSTLIPRSWAILPWKHFKIYSRWTSEILARDYAWVAGSCGLSWWIPMPILFRPEGWSLRVAPWEVLILYPEGERMWMVAKRFKEGRRDSGDAFAGDDCAHPIEALRCLARENLFPEDY